MKKSKVKSKDMVNHPDHYGGDSVYEVLKVLEAWMSKEQFIGMCRGQAMIYLARADKKGNTIEDLKKAAFYINYEVGYRQRLVVGLTGNGRAELKEHIKGVTLEELIDQTLKDQDDDPFEDFEDEERVADDPIPEGYSWDTERTVFRNRHGSVTSTIFRRKWLPRASEFPVYARAKV